MKLWSRIRQMSPSQLIHFLWVLLKRPLLIRPCLAASRKTLDICNRLYGGSHHRNGRSNAFRHALWNILIAQRSLIRLKNIEKSAEWAEKITNLYEKVTKNEVLDQLMDLHNNRLGRTYFFQLYDQKEADIVQFLQEKLKNAKKMKKKEDLINFPDSMVYISEN